MKPTRTSDLKSLIGSTRDQLEECRSKRVAFEREMDINSCEEHNALARLCYAEKKLASELEVAEHRLLRARRRFWLQALAALGGSLVAGSSIAYLVYAG